MLSSLYTMLQLLVVFSRQAQPPSTFVPDSLEILHSLSISTATASSRRLTTAGSARVFGGVRPESAVFVVYVVSIGVGLGVGVLFLFHLFLVFSAQTTIELFAGHALAHARSHTHGPHCRHDDLGLGGLGGEQESMGMKEHSPNPAVSGTMGCFRTGLIKILCCAGPIRTPYSTGSACSNWQQVLGPGPWFLSILPSLRQPYYSASSSPPPTWGAGPAASVV